MKRRQRRPFEALGQLAVDETQMALDDDGFDAAKCHHHQESKSGSFVRRKFVEPRLGFYEQRREIGVGSPDLHSGTHQSADGQERGRFQRRCVLSELNCKVDQRDTDQHCSDDLTDRSNRFPVHLHTPIIRLTRHKISDSASQNCCSHALTEQVPKPPTRHRKPWESAPWCGKGRRHYRFGLSLSLLRSSSEARLNHSTIHPERGPVGCGGQWAAHVNHQIGYLFRHRESLQKRRRADGLEKLLFKFCKRFAAAKLSRKFFHTGGMSWTGQYRVHRDSC